MQDDETVDEMIRRRRGDARPALRFEDEEWTWHEHAAASATRAAVAGALRRPGPFHIGYLLENVPELSFWLGAGAVCGATMVGVNPTRRGAELASDIRHTDCQLVVTERKLLGLLDGLDLGISRDRVLVVDSDEHRELCERHRTTAFPDRSVPPDSAALLVFTSGTSGAPKAAIVSQRRLARYGRTLSAGQELSAESVCYLAMPMFHSNALYAGWSPAVYVGATIALRRRFSASAFLDDVRRYRATYFNYVGKPLSYILATPPRPDDRDHDLVRVVGNEGTERDVARFSERFGVLVLDNYGSTEGGVTVMRSPEQPKGALGRLPEGVLVVDPEHGTPRAPARVRRVRPAPQPRGVHRRDRQHRPGLVRGLLQKRRSRRGPNPERVVLVGGPRLRGRRRMVVVRRTRLRLAAGRRRELRRRAGRAHRRRVPGRRARRRLRRPRHRRRRRRDGRAAARARRGVRTGPRSTSSCSASPTSAPSGAPATCGSRPTSPSPRRAKILKRRLRAERWECDGPGLVAARARRATAAG